MPISNQRIAVFIALVAAGCGEAARDPSVYACAEEDPGDGHPRAARFRQIVDDSVRAGIPGLALLVRDGDGRWMGAGGAADLASGAPMRTCSLSSVASITKTFVAATALKLVEEGRLRLDDPARDWLPPGATDGLANADVATVRQLLDHSSGIPNYNDSLDFLTDVFNDPTRLLPSGYDYLDYVRGMPAYFPPGAGNHYSNSNYLLLGMVIDAAAGEHHTQAIRDRVLGPLAMNRSVYDWRNPSPAGLVRGYSELQGDGRLVDVTDDVFAEEPNTPAGGLHATAPELASFIEALLRDGTLLRPESLRAMQQWVMPGPNFKPGYSRYGLGLEYLEGDGGGYAIGHTGGLFGYSAYMLYFPERDVTIVALANLGADAPLGSTLVGDLQRQLMLLPYEGRP
jgi:D-alanyl-D-alanine carboxypeptidase